MGAGMGGYNSVLGNLYRELQDQRSGADGQDDGTTIPQGAPLQQPGMGPGEAQNFNYGQQGGYNTLAQDLSRNVMGNYNFGGGMMNYSPFGNPYAPPPRSFPSGPPGYIPPDIMGQPPGGFPRGRFPGRDYRGMEGFGGRGSFPGYGYGGMPGRFNQPPHMGYGGAYGGGMHGSYGTPYARPPFGQHIQHIQQPKPYNFGGGPDMMATTRPVGPNPMLM